MTKLSVSPSTRILLLAPKLLGESLALQLNKGDPSLEISFDTSNPDKRPSLVIWSIESLEAPNAIQIEIARLKEKWNPAPLLILLPEYLRLSTTELLQFDCQGILQSPDIKLLREAITKLLKGGRIVHLTKKETLVSPETEITMGLGQWLLFSGVQQIGHDLESLESLLNKPLTNPLLILLVEGRQRELKSSMSLLRWLWGPLKVTPGLRVNTSKTLSNESMKVNKTNDQIHDSYSTNISINGCNSRAVWEAINARLKDIVNSEVGNATGNLLAIQALNPTRRRHLLIALLGQLDELLLKLTKLKNEESQLSIPWLDNQPELCKQALREMVGNYFRLQKRGELKHVADEVIEITTLGINDEELPEPERILEPFIKDKPVLVDGQLLPAHDPRALIQLELYVSNWLIRTAESISAEVLEVCSEWPELRSQILDQKLISTRELERLRNQLNSETRWRKMVQRPIRLYESKRLLFSFKNGNIENILITEPRDDELRQLGWWQQQVALLLEARDALAPQVQNLIKKIGDLMVVLLTKVVGRSIGLVGKGIAQGMGRNLGRG